MLQKFLSLFTRRNAAKRHITMPEPPAEESWADIAARVKAEQTAKQNLDRNQPFMSGTPYARIHELIATGRPDELIAVELGVELTAVRNYRDIIGAKARQAARQRAAEARVPAMLTRGELDEDIAAALGLSLLVVQNIRTDMVNERRRAARWLQHSMRVTPAVLQPRPYQQAMLDDMRRLPLDAGLAASLAAGLSHGPSSCPAPAPAPAPDFSSGGGGGASGSYDNP